MNDDAASAILAYGALLGLNCDELDEPALIEETIALLAALRAVAERDLGETPLPMTFAPKQT